MSNNVKYPDVPAIIVQTPLEEHARLPVPSSEPIYPTSGAFQHLPARRTLSGRLAVGHPNADKIFLRNLPAHCYTLPNVPLNFTLVEIIVLLPNWFKNRALAARFMNNNINATIHFMILEEHREIEFATEAEKDKARKTLTDEYRKAMRKTFGGSWTKLKHAAPHGWDPLLLAMDGFVPDDAKLQTYRWPASIPFHDLMVGVKKLPEGARAGDLTRALHYAQQQSNDYMFPEGLPMILDIIGRTKITNAHTDCSIMQHYVALKDNVNKPLPKYDWGNHANIDELAARIHAKPYDRDQVRVAMTLSQHVNRPLEEISWEVHNHPSVVQRYRAKESQRPAQVVPSPVHTQKLANAVDAPPPPPPPQIKSAVVTAQVAKQSQNMTAQQSVEEGHALMRGHQDQVHMHRPPGSPHYSPRHLLRECAEGNIGFDGSLLAKAARFAQQADQLGTDWYVENVPWLSQLLEAAQRI